MRIHHSYSVRTIEFFTIIVFFVINPVFPQAAIPAAKQISNNLVSIHAIQQHGKWVGFDVAAKGGKTAAIVRLCSRKLIYADNCQARGRYMRFTGIHSNPNEIITFNPGDAITVRLNKGSPFPDVWFNLTLISFHPSRWRQAAGAQPFHFLAIFMPEAQVWQQQVWLNASPYADKFPLLEDVHIGSPEISAYHYNRSWSYTPPLGANALPVIGLWAPQIKKYAGFEFQTTRLEDNTEKNIASGYHWRATDRTVNGDPPGQFVSLVYPYGGHGYQSLVFPRNGSVIASHGRLLWSLNLNAANDPSRFVWKYVWGRDRNLLPRVPERVNLSWIPGGIRLSDFPGPASTMLYGGPEAQFQTPGSLLQGGWDWYLETPTSVAVSAGDTNTINALKSEADQLLSYAKRFQSGNEKCIYWDKPLKGSWTAQWGGSAATTIHNANGFAFGRLYLSLYRYANQKQYLPVVDGVFNWAKHIAWTRAEFSDVPSSPFAIGGTLPTSFCLAYYMAFKDAPDKRHRIRAKEALDLARSFVYRYMIMWPSDNNWDDDLHPEFLWGGGNSGRDWMGAATSNEVFNNLDTLAQAAVETGDPILMWALQGSLNSWHQLYQDVSKPSLAKYTRNDMAEGFGLFPGDIYGVGRRSDYGFSNSLYMTYPIGKSRIRVLAGCRAAMAFDKDGAASSISDYHYTPNGNLSFMLHTSLPSVDVSLTVPYEDIHSQPVEIVSQGMRSDLNPGRDYMRPKQNLWSLYIPNLHDETEVIIGHPNENSKPLPDRPPRLQKMPVNKKRQNSFETAAIPTNIKESANWSDLHSWAGVPGSVIWAWGVPFDLSPADNLQALTVRRAALKTPIFGPAVLFLAYSAGRGKRPSLILSSGREVPVNQNSEASAWRAWPPIFTARILMAPVAIAKREKVTGIDPGSRVVWALTVQQSVAEENQVSALLKNAHQAYLAQARQIHELNTLIRLIAAIPKGSFAVLPTVFEPGAGIGADNILVKAGLLNRGVMLTPEELIDPLIFNPDKYPVVVDAGEEDYIETVQKPGDAADALKSYLEKGGTLLLIAQGPYPLAYGNGPNGYRDNRLLPPALGLPLYNAIETRPVEAPVIHRDPAAMSLGSLPETLLYPFGDSRLRSVNPLEIPTGEKYTPYFTVTGSNGASYGDAAGMALLPSGGRIIYFWGGLLRDLNHDAPIARAIVKNFILRR